MQEDEQAYVWKKIKVDEVVVGFFHLEKLEAVADAARAVRDDSPDEGNNIIIEVSERAYIRLGDTLGALDALDMQS